MNAVEIVDALLEGDVTRDRLASVYGKLSRQAQGVMAQHKPCKPQKNAQGQMTCVGCQEHPKHEPSHYQLGIQPDELCCRGCGHHEPGQGCKTEDPLACQTWLCPTAAKQDPEADKKLHRIARRAYKAGVWHPRTGKMGSLDKGEDYWKNYDMNPETKRWLAGYGVPKPPAE